MGMLNSGCMYPFTVAAEPKVRLEKEGVRNYTEAKASL